MAAANIENFSVCRFIIFLVILLRPDVVAGRLASAVPLGNLRKNRCVLRVGTRKGAQTDENVKGISHAKAQRNAKELLSGVD